MRIIDKTGKDYYDGTLLSMYREVDLLLVRNQKSTPIDSSKGPRWWSWQDWDWGDLNKEYPFGQQRFGQVRRDPNNFKCVDYDYLYFIGFCGNVYPVFRRDNEYDYIDELNLSQTLFEKYKSPPKIFQNHWQVMMEEMNCPVFVCNCLEQTIYWGEHLEGYQFYKVMNHYQAAQSIYQWLSNKNNPEKPIPSLSNNDMIEIHGFDLKKSFRHRK